MLNLWRNAYLVVVLSLTVYVGMLLAQPSPTMNPATDALAFDYPDDDFLSYQVTGFQVAWDGGPWTAISQTITFRDANTAPGATSYQVIPPFKSGQHTALFRACNAVGCGGSSAPFPFAYFDAPSGNAPSNIRIVKQ